MTCRIEINATSIASEKADSFGYKGGTIQCPKRDRCKGEDHCAWEDYRTIWVFQRMSADQPTPVQKFYSRAEKSLDLMQRVR